MMTQRNVELQLQALDLIERRQHSTQKDDEDAATSTVDESVTQVDIALVCFSNSNMQVEIVFFFWFLTRNIAADESAEKELFEEVEKELVDEARPLSTDDDDDTTNDKFQRLNLFFEKEKVIYYALPWILTF